MLVQYPNLRPVLGFKDSLKHRRYFNVALLVASYDGTFENIVLGLYKQFGDYHKC